MQMPTQLYTFISVVYSSIVNVKIQLPELLRASSVHMPVSNHRCRSIF